MRVLITGGPKTGKTTLSCEFRSCPVYHADGLIGRGWSAQSDEIVRWLDQPGPWVIEGVAVVRGLRKWLRSHPEGLPFDDLIYLTEPVIALTDGQRSMTKATKTIWDEIHPTIVARLAG